MSMSSPLSAILCELADDLSVEPEKIVLFWCKLVRSEFLQPLMLIEN